jgi:polyhydroxyalkanoic acid synthase PhaR subunit
MSDETKSGSPIDPFNFWKKMMDASEEMSSNAMNQFVNTDKFAASMGKNMESAMTMQKVLQDNMEKYLHLQGLPTLHDFTRLSSQIVDIDARLDDLQEKIESNSTSAEIKKISGHLGNLEVRLSKIENTLEQIMKALHLQAAATDDKAVVENQATVEGDAGYYPLGEASPVSKKAAKRKVTEETAE